MVASLYSQPELRNLFQDDGIVWFHFEHFVMYSSLEECAIDSFSNN